MLLQPKPVVCLPHPTSTLLGHVAVTVGEVRKEERGSVYPPQVGGGERTLLADSVNQEMVLSELRVCLWLSRNIMNNKFRE